MRIGRLLFPALRWDPERGFAHYREAVETGLELGVGGFILFGGEADAVRELCAELHERSAVPLLIGSDLERGAGQQFRGATPLPPVAALGALEELEATRRAGELTAREARALGVNWVYAPVADVDVEPRNPIVGSRAFGTDPERVAAHVAAWVEGCREGGGLSCAKHFPGHGRTVADSHLELARVEQGRDAIDEDLVPFRAAARAGVDSMMSAHVAYPALDPSGAPATLSRPILEGLLRGELGYGGLIVTDALIMEGVLEGGAGEGEAAVRAVAAGCDALLYPGDMRAVAQAVEAAVGRELSEARVEEALARIDAAARRVAGAPEGEWGGEPDGRWALDVALRSLRLVRGRRTPVGEAVALVTVDDDVGGPYPPGPRDALAAELRAAGVAVHETEVGGAAEAAGAVVVAVYADIRAWKGRPGLSAEARAAVERVVDARPGAGVLLFGHPRLAAELPEGATVLGAWGGEPLMQRAAARWLTAAAES